MTTLHKSWKTLLVCCVLFGNFFPGTSLLYLNCSVHSALVYVKSNSLINEIKIFKVNLEYSQSYSHPLISGSKSGRRLFLLISQNACFHRTLTIVNNNVNNELGCFDVQWTIQSTNKPTTAESIEMDNMTEAYLLGMTDRKHTVSELAFLGSWHKIHKQYMITVFWEKCVPSTFTI